MFVNETDAPVTGTQTHVTFGTFKRFQITVAGVGEVFNRCLHQFPVAASKPLQIFHRSRAKENPLYLLNPAEPFEGNIRRRVRQCRMDRRMFLSLFRLVIFRSQKYGQFHGID